MPTSSLSTFDYIYIYIIISWVDLGVFCSMLVKIRFFDEIFKNTMIQMMMMMIFEELIN